MVRDAMTPVRRGQRPSIRLAPARGMYSQRAHTIQNIHSIAVKRIIEG
jgi:hypothetical protein